MSYAQFGLIEASDFNNLVGGNPSTTANRLNTVWAVGGTNAGYGQTAVSNVAIGNTVTASNWASLVNTTSSIASHQGSTISSVTAPSTGNTVAFLSAVPTNLTTVYNNRLNAVSQGTTSSNTATFGSSWSSALTFTHTVTFASGDAARYFFNAGGQIAVTCSHPNGSGINLLFNGLASNIGSVVLSSPISGSIVVAGTSYNGVTKIGGGGNSPTISTNSGYYGLTTANTTIFTQTASTGPSGYLSTFISVLARTNGTQGSNGDVGSVITLHTIWDEVPNGLAVSAGSATTVTIRPPSQTYLSAAWGTPTVAGTVTGS